jgi:hypothetical protein
MFAGHILLALLKCALYLFQEIKSRQWRRVPATITSCVGRDTIGRPMITLTYETISQHGSSPATTRIPFVLAESADQYAQRFKKNQEVIVRVNPANPSRTLFVDGDQKSGSGEQRNRITR